MWSFMSMRGRRSDTVSLSKNGLAIVAFLAAVVIPNSLFAQNAGQAWLTYRAVGKPLRVPTRVDALGQSLVEQTAAIELRRGLLSLSGGAPLENGPNMILLGTVAEIRARQSQGGVPSLEADE